MVKVKFCGLRRPCDIEAANSLKPNYIGFIFAPKSKRYVSPGEAKALKAMLSPEISAVGVFVDASKEEIVALAQDSVIDVVQLHGNEDETYIENLKKMLPDTRIFKAFRIDGKEDVQKALKSAADMVLLDAGNGGTGTAFDWSLVKAFPRPYFLAGGLDAKKVVSALQGLCPYGVDVSSGIETNGFKDPQKMKEFMSAIERKK